MKCKGCGAELSNIQLFCPHCGTKNEPAGEFKFKCVKCGKVFPESVNYCNVCGGQLVSAQPNIPVQNQVPPVQLPPQSQVTPQPRPLPPYQPQGQMPPQPMPLPPYTQKTKKSALPIVIIVGLIVILLGGGIGAVAIYNHMAKLDKVPSFSELFNKSSSNEDNSSDDASSGNSDYNPSYGNAAADNSNYNNYIGSREVVPIDQFTEVLMGNGIAFYLNDVYLTDNGDGTATVDCNMYLMAYLSGSDLYSDDFIVLPMDSSGNAVSDAVKIGSITDTSGYSQSTPLILNSTYYTYTVSFTVPSNTTNITFYGVNIQLDSSTSGGASASGPVYYIDITFQ